MMTCVQFLQPRRKEKVNTEKLSTDFHTCITAHTCAHTPHTHICTAQAAYNTYTLHTHTYTTHTAHTHSAQIAHTHGTHTHTVTKNVRFIVLLFVAS